MLNFVPAWLLRLIVEYGVKWLCKKVGLDATVVHVESAVAKITPLPPEVNPSPKERQGPIEKHYGG